MWRVISCWSLIGWLSFSFFLKFDLVNTIGEAAALGAAGVVSWGDMNVTDTEVESDITLEFSGVVFELIRQFATFLNNH